MGSKKIGKSVLGKSSSRSGGPTKEELDELKQRMEEEKEEKAKEMAAKLEADVMKSKMPEAHGEPTHSAKLIGQEDIDDAIEKEKKEAERKRKRKLKINIEEV